MSVNVSFTPEFKRNLRALSRKFRHIREDIDPLIDQLQNGQLPGDQVTGTGYTIFKVRISNRDVQKGKSGGYRLIYYLQTKAEIILITIYSKAEQADISASQIRRIVGEFDAG